MAVKDQELDSGLSELDVPHPIPLVQKYIQHLVKGLSIRHPSSTAKENSTDKLRTSLRMPRTVTPVCCPLAFSVTPAYFWH
jgi:hypothetical protein